MCFVEGGQNRKFVRLSESKRKESMLSLVSEAFGESRADEVQDVIEHNWADDEYSRGAYSSFPMTGVLTNFWRPLSNIYSKQQLGLPGIWIAGADHSSHGRGYIDGAVRS